MAIEIEVWREYEIADIAKAVEESQGKPFRVWGSFHTCYFDLDYDPEYNLMFAYMVNYHALKDVAWKTQDFQRKS